MIRIVTLILILCCLTVSTVQAEEIILSTGIGPLDSIIKPVKSAFEKETGLTVRVLLSGSSLAFKQFHKGVSDAAVVGTSFEGMLNMMKNEGFEVTDRDSFQHVTLGRGIVRTVVNKDNPVSKLSKEQLKGIFTGKITNWKDVGGNDSPILVIVYPLIQATIGTFKQIILDNEPFTSEVMEPVQMDELRSAVELNPEAIAIGTMSILGTGVKQVATPEVSRPYILITRGKPTPRVQKFIDFIVTGPGKGLVTD